MKNLSDLKIGLKVDDEKMMKAYYQILDIIKELKEFKKISKKINENKRTFNTNKNV